MTAIVQHRNPAIDGSKLDWIHYKEGGSYGMGADMKINVVFDVFSEKIIGWDFTDTEDHKSQEPLRRSLV